MLRMKDTERERERETGSVLISVTVKQGWYSRKPAHSCKKIRDSGDSKGDGRYWIEPENSGNPLNVYCDMTTDGGKICFVLRRYT